MIDVMPFLFAYGTLQQEDVQLSTFGRRLHGHMLASGTHAWVYGCSCPE